MRTSNITKLRTCGCGFQILRSCGLAVADFKYYEVVDLRLRISNITKLWTCGCGLQELESCGLAVADSKISKSRCELAVAD